MQRGVEQSPRSHVPRNCVPRSHMYPPGAVSPGAVSPRARAAALPPPGSQALLGVRFFPGRLHSLFSSIPPLHPPSSVILVPFPKGNKVSSNTVPTRKAKAPPTPLFPSSFGFRVMCPMTKQAQIPAQRALPFSLKGESLSRARGVPLPRCLWDGQAGLSLPLVTARHGRQRWWVEIG